MPRTQEDPAAARLGESILPTHDLREVAGPDVATRRELKRNPYSPVMILLTIIATGGILAYAIFLLNPANRGDTLPYVLVIGAEAILIAHALLAMWDDLGQERPRPCLLRAVGDVPADQMILLDVGRDTIAQYKSCCPRLATVWKRPCGRV